MAMVDFGLMLRAYDPDRSLQETTAYNQRCIEALTAGFSTLWLEDHLQFGATDAPECLTTLCYLAALYPQFRVGTLVLSQSYRNPALLAKMAANIQMLTGGRLILGLGAGWKEDEYTAYGYPFPSTATRMDQLEEAIQAIRALWTQRPATFEGQHYAIRNAYCVPQPSPMIPLLIGGGGEKRTLAIVARYADWWNFNSCTVEEYGHKLTILRQHCERAGRNPDEIQLTYLGTLSVAEDPAQVLHHPQKHYIAGNAVQVIHELEQFSALGIRHFMFRIPNVETLEHFVSRVVPHFA
jgi:alkanesulfonate monooxygenase SsuD/methylene tetrahydromethanopterin reductase-like flavin-dependent oxidoreductase (luciferase family)